jgi:hypothetical protein
MNTAERDVSALRRCLDMVPADGRPADDVAG